MSYFGGSKVRQAHLTACAKLPYDLTKPLQDAADCLLINAKHGYSFPLSAKVKIDKTTIGAHILAMGMYIPELSALNDQPYSLAQTIDIANCVHTLEYLLIQASKDAPEHNGPQLRKEICLAIPHYLYEHGACTDTTSLFNSPYEPTHDLRILIDYALFICSNVANGVENATFPSVKPSPAPKRPSLGRKLTSFGKSVAEKLTK